MGENRISDILDISKLTPEQKKQEEEDFLRKCYICNKCSSLHLTDQNVEGNICFPPMGDHYCDGILRKVKDLDEIFPTG